MIVGQQKFPWTSHGITFTSRSHLERTVERLAHGQTLEHVSAAQKLLREAHQHHKLSADQYTEIKGRLHL
ncbi:hypothetical protein [Pseudomonas psychrophila]|uniref:Uncharacterized protein n=1 Tax=Pseudomonas psychrophila TaxID=122355 RepID=A0A8I1K6V2_9PSED|nr:hypothetical protein [Pseudomonas psychrophila]AVX93261.1 hypothetical protein PkP19E3_34570 [Pseudomonas koreensis]MBJ2259184.1 hypothetical protein [Pseudomonas psychrophila]